MLGSLAFGKPAAFAAAVTFGAEVLVDRHVLAVDRHLHAASRPRRTFSL